MVQARSDASESAGRAEVLFVGVVITEGQRFTVEDWERAGTRIDLAGIPTFVMVVDPLREELFEPLLVLHGFPTSSYDFRHVVSGLARNRRVLLCDLPGFGLSAKPDIRYSIELHADVVAAYVEQLGEKRLALLTHDMGDSIGGEALARSLDGSWPCEFTKRVVTNGSIYLDLAHLTDGQKMLLSLPDELLAEGPGAGPLATSLAATMAAGSHAARADLEGDAALILREKGNALLPRTIRYIEDRRRAESRYTGAIESHPSPVAVVWGTEDPIAVSAMASRFAERRPDATIHLLDRTGHYLMLEDPDRFVSFATAFLDRTS
jgi:pimeloyl-ACP methyl ester carboxylesterase